MIGIKPPPLWTSMNAVRSYEKAMTDTNEQLISTIFNEDEVKLIKATKQYVESYIPDWVKSNAFVVLAGGCFASRLHGENAKDFDIFVLGHSDPEEEKKMHEAIRRKMQISLPNIEDKTDNYSRGNDAVSEVWTDKNRKIQFIFTHHQTREDLIKDFDYVHCMTSYHLHKLYITRKIFNAIREKDLIVNNDKNVQVWRRSKFRDRGYKDPEQKELTLGDIFAGALKKIQTTQTTSTMYEWDDSDDEFSWVR